LRQALLSLLLGASLAVAGSAAASSSSRADLHDTTIPLGSTYTITGQTAPRNGRRITGTVTLAGKLNSGPWLVLARTRTNASGFFKLAISPTRRGRLQLRLATPDHQVRRVTLTIT
jgi:hypothetical protein